MLILEHKVKKSKNINLLNNLLYVIEYRINSIEYR